MEFYSEISPTDLAEISVPGEKQGGVLMKENKFRLIGCKINSIYFYSFENRLLFSIEKNKLSAIKLRQTMARLLEYLLTNAQERVVSDNEIMMNVWEGYDLKSSSQRLWQVMENLKSILLKIGVSCYFIMRVNSNGYLIRKDTTLGLYAKSCD